MEAIKTLREKARNVDAKIVLPEGSEPRAIKAAAQISREKISRVILLPSTKGVEETLKAENADMERIEIIDIKNSPLLDKYIDMFYELRKHKGISKDDAKNAIINNSLYFGALMVREGLANGFVAGAVNTTRDVARSCLWCIGLDRAVRTMSSSFIMIVPHKEFGASGVFIYADCGIIPFPSPRQLASIAMTSSELMSIIFEAEPKVAMLSFSTKGSGEMDAIEKIHKAIDIVKEKKPGLMIDGEIQADAALVPEVAKIKAPKSPLKGEANVLIFPNLEAGNISYKLTQRLAKARALGPLLNGLQAPCSDLSRGCTTDDIVDIVAVTALRCAYNKKV